MRLVVPWMPEFACKAWPETNHHIILVKFMIIDFNQEYLPDQKLIIGSAKSACLILMCCRAFVGRKSPGVGDMRVPRYRREWQGAIRLKRVDMFWIWEVFGSVITVGS